MSLGFVEPPSLVPEWPCQRVGYDARYSCVRKTVSRVCDASPVRLKPLRMQEFRVIYGVSK